ncbi:MAG TPA: hypothetical protein VND65_08165 [Candidatus Binatia bacterium]|nr:hypothetical protein [Candidatus Binatia bacterium]
MNQIRLCQKIRAIPIVAAWLFISAFAAAETCQTANDMDAATRTALTSAADRYFSMVANGDVNSLKQNAIPAVAADFSGIASTIQAHQADLTGSKATVRPPFVLQTEGSAPTARAEFLCGVFGERGQTSNSAVFTLNNLPPGKYAIAISDAATAKGPFSVSFVLQQVGSEWKLGGLYIKAGQIAGHDSNWYIAKAKEFQSKGQQHNAWLYYLEARSLISPLPFMSTAVTDKLYDDSQKLQPADLPADGKPVVLSAAGATYKLSAVFPEIVGNDLDLIVRYDVASVADTNRAYQSNVAVMKGLVAKYPEVKDAFAGVVARAVDPGGHDYGTLLAMKDIK